MVEVDNVVKLYGDLEAVKGVSFSMEKGEVLGLLGPNAAGKTTLMRIITGYLPATSGTVRVAGFDVFEQPMEVKRRVGYLPEQPPLYMDMTVKAYLNFVAEIKGVPRRARRARVADVMDMVSIEHIAGRLIENISKGYKQRVGLAQALVNSPDVLILDEPTVGLDPEQIIEIRELIKRLGKSQTIMLSSHILSEVSATCDRVVILREGRVAAVDTQAGLQNRFSGMAVLQTEITGPAGDVAAALKKVPGVETVERTGDTAAGATMFLLRTHAERDARGDVFQCVVSNGWTLLELRRDDLSLEEIFLKLTTGDGAPEFEVKPEGEGARPCAPTVDAGAMESDEETSAPESGNKQEGGHD